MCITINRELKVKEKLIQESSIYIDPLNISGESVRVYTNIR